MFGGKQDRPEKPLDGSKPKLDSLIAGNVEVIGDVYFSGGLRIDGKIQGNVIHKQGSNGLLVLSEKGSVIGKVESYNAIVNGTVNGDLIVHNFLELQSKAKVSGNIGYNQLQMECGAAIDGKISHLEEQKGKPAAAESKKDELKDEKRKDIKQEAPPLFPQKTLDTQSKP